VGRENKASFTNLAPGTYTFRVKASNNDGIWNEAGASIKVIITPPFWNSWWFRALIALAFFSAVIAYYQFRKRQVVRKLEESKREEIHEMQLQFFTNISHEFRTPLSLILGPLEKLEKENNQPAFAHYYRVMHRNVNRMLELINELMDFRKAETGALKLKVMPGNLPLFLDELEEEFRELANERKMKFEIHLPEKIEEPCFDRQVLEKIITNLVSNAFKYTADGGSVFVEVLPSLKNFQPSFPNELLIKNNYHPKRAIYLRVADNGIGISKESLPYLFERYYRTTEAHMGSGVGLAFVKSLTLLHKGSIVVYSEPNKGTEIIIALPVDKDDYTKEEKWIRHKEGAAVMLETIPLKHESAVPGDTTNNTEVDTNTPQQKQCILIVDDNLELRSFISDSLSSHYKVIQASDGKQGLAKAKEFVPDLVISDIMMPLMDGIEFCKRFKEDINLSHIPFLMLTAKDALESRIEGTGSGADYYFSKPVSIELLLLTIRNIFDQKQKLKDRYQKDYHAQAKDLVHSLRDKEFMEELLSIIEMQLTNPELDVEYICTNIGMSRTRLYQKIKSITGQSIGDFVRTIRLRKAVEIMTHEDVSLLDVMFRVGIQTQSYFTKAFKKEFGKTPTQFLQELKK
jgi:signal transduction histidine kinase/DNA-binding response OmpR family regulator